MDTAYFVFFFHFFFFVCFFPQSKPQICGLGAGSQSSNKHSKFILETSLVFPEISSAFVLQFYSSFPHSCFGGKLLSLLDLCYFH